MSKRIKLEKNLANIFNRDSDCCYENDESSPILEADELENATLSQWSSVDGSIIPVSNTFSKLEAGYYSMHTSQSLGLYFRKEEISLNKLYRLPNKATDIILDDISKFWTLENTYKKYNRVFRRNYLLYSAPGTGKTSLINLMCDELINKYNGIVLSLSTREDVMMYVEGVKLIRKVEPDRKIITIIEDIDNFIGSDDYTAGLDTYLLNILDGNMKINGVVTIATTNFIERVQERYKNRPSRFDRVIEFPLPNDASRKLFIEKSVLPEDLESIDMDKWVNRTRGFTIDHINELIILHFVFGHDEDEAFETVSNMVDNNGSLRNEESVNKKRGIGFSN